MCAPNTYIASRGAQWRRHRAPFGIGPRDLRDRTAVAELAIKSKAPTWDKREGQAEVHIGRTSRTKRRRNRTEAEKGEN